MNWSAIRPSSESLEFVTLPLMMMSFCAGDRQRRAVVARGRRRPRSRPASCTGRRSSGSARRCRSGRRSARSSGRPSSCRSTVMLLAPRTIVVLPGEDVGGQRSCRAAACSSAASSAAAPTRCRCRVNVGLELEHAERQPGLDAETSIESSIVRPKIGWPQIRNSSFVCTGPLSASPAANWISPHFWREVVRLVAARRTTCRCSVLLAAPVAVPAAVVRRPLRDVRDRRRAVDVARVPRRVERLDVGEVEEVQEAAAAELRDDAALDAAHLAGRADADQAVLHERAPTGSIVLHGV